MLSDEWFPDGIVVKGSRTGVTEVLPEPYSLESAERLVRTYASLWLEHIEWWGIGAEDHRRYVTIPKRLDPRARRFASNTGI